MCVCATVCWLAVDGSSWKMASAAIYQTEATFIELKFAIFTYKLKDLQSDDGDSISIWQKHALQLWIEFGEFLLTFFLCTARMLPGRLDFSFFLQNTFLAQLCWSRDTSRNWWGFPSEMFPPLVYDNCLVQLSDLHWVCMACPMFTEWSVDVNQMKCVTLTVLTERYLT